MDPATLTSFLAPFLPALLGLGTKAAEGAAAKIGETSGTQLAASALNTAKAIWQKLQPQIQAKAAAQEAAADVANSPDDPDAQAALRLQIKKILEADAALSEAIAQLMEQATPDSTTGTRIVQTVTGSSNQVIGQVSGGQVFGNVTGNIAFGAAPSSPAAAEATASALPKTILILAANPRGTSPLQLAQEVREIQAGLDRARQRDRFLLAQQWAVSDKEVRRALLDYSPHIVHFSGHGVGKEGQLAPNSRKFTTVDAAAEAPAGLILEDITGQPQLVSGAALGDLFALFADQVECVVLNACYSAMQAQAIAKHIPYVVGMQHEIGDNAAIQFAVGFYDAILAGKSIEFAYRLGCAAVRTAGIPEHLTPVLQRFQS